jgi:hypothetical protein
MNSRSLSQLGLAESLPVVRLDRLDHPVNGGIASQKKTAALPGSQSPPSCDQVVINPNVPSSLANYSDSLSRPRLRQLNFSASLSFSLIRERSVGFMIGCRAYDRRLAVWSELDRPAEGRLGKRVGCKPSRVRIPHPPPLYYRVAVLLTLNCRGSQDKANQQAYGRDGGHDHGSRRRSP